jgi:hypothetical protein
VTDVPRPIETLRSFARARPREAKETCDFCAAGLDRRHEHLLDAVRGDVRCACSGCALVVSAKEASPWKRVPDRVERLGVGLSDEEWASLGLPIDVAFFVRSSRARRTVALYPSPGGAIESALPLDAWSALAATHPELATLEPDVEAFLVNRRGGAREHWRVSLDRCYRLVGLVRRSWRGFTGGPVVAAELERFFADLAEECGA